MDIRPISTEASVSDQLKCQDMTLIKSLGYRSVVCNRPDGEAADQPLFTAVSKAADLSGIEAHYLPVPSTGAGPGQVAAMRKLWSDLPKPVLMYCRSGARSTALINAAVPANQIG